MTGTGDSFLGDITVETLYPNGDGAANQWLGSDGNSTSNYLLVNETGAPVTTSYTGDSVSGHRDLYTLTDLVATTGTVVGVCHQAYAAASDAVTSRQMKVVNHVTFDAKLCDLHALHHLRELLLRAHREPGNRRERGRSPTSTRCSRVLRSCRCRLMPVMPAHRYVLLSALHRPTPVMPAHRYASPSCPAAAVSSGPVRARSPSPGRGPRRRSPSSPGPAPAGSCSPGRGTPPVSPPPVPARSPSRGRGRPGSVSTGPAGSPSRGRGPSRSALTAPAGSCSTATATPTSPPTSTCTPHRNGHGSSSTRPPGTRPVPSPSPRRASSRSSSTGPRPSSFTLPGQHPQTAIVAELATDVVVARNGRLLFRGRVGASTETHSGTVDTVNFTAVDYRGMLDHRVLWPDSTLEYTGVDQSDIAWQVIADTQALGNLGITRGVGAVTGVVRDRTFTAGGHCRADVERSRRRRRRVRLGHRPEPGVQRVPPATGPQHRPRSRLRPRHRRGHHHRRPVQIRERRLLHRRHPPDVARDPDRHRARRDRTVGTPKSGRERHLASHRRPGSGRRARRRVAADLGAHCHPARRPRGTRTRCGSATPYGSSCGPAASTST